MITQFLQPGSPNLLLTSLVGWFAVVNLLAFVGFFLDHRRALADEGSVPEMPLLVLSTVGGWLGAQLGRLLFRAQTRERSFGVFLNISILPMLALAAMMASQDVDWSSLAGKVTEMMTPKTEAPPAETAAVAPAADIAKPEAVKAEAPKPIVRKPDAKKPAKPSVTKAASVTDNPDLPKRFGPGSKKEAWQSR